MKQLRGLIVIVIVIGLCNCTEPKGDIYLDDNGVTVKAKDGVAVGFTGVINGVIYTLVDESTLRSMVSNDADVTKVVTTGITNMKNIFRFKATFNQDIGSWDVSQVIIMDNMFNQAIAFNQNLGSWDVSSVTTMGSMFSGTRAFNQNLNSWDVSSVTIMDSMFFGALAFNGDIGSWDVSQVTDMRGMFRSALAFDQDISSWDVSQVTMHNSFDGNNPGSWTASEKPNFN